MSTLGDRVLLKRRQLDIKQAVLAQRAQISPTYLSEIERGKATNVTIDIVFHLAEALGISVPYLLGLSDAPTSADDGAPIEAGQDRLTFEVRDPELRALMVELADLMHGMTPAQRRYFADQVRLMRRLMEEEESRAKNPIIIG